MAPETHKFVTEVAELSQPLWTPSVNRRENSLWSQFVNEYCPGTDLGKYAKTDPAKFWRQLWDWSEIVGEPGERSAETSGDFFGQSFLPDAEINFAENMLRNPAGVDKTSEAIISVTETGTRKTLSWLELHSEVTSLATKFEALGVKPGDRVAAWMPNIAETVVAFLASAAIGAVFTSTSADFGVAGVVDRFSQVEPKLLIAADGYQYGGKTFKLRQKLDEIKAQLPTVTQVILVSNLDQTPTAELNETLWADAVTELHPEPFMFKRFKSNHPIFILYSSGTTGKPKCIVHRSGGILLKHLSEHRLHCDIRPGDTVSYFTTCGWMMWNWLVSCLGSGATIVLYEGSPAFGSVGHLFELAATHKVTLLGASAKYFDAVAKADYVPKKECDLNLLKTLCSTGSPLSHERFEWVYDSVKTDVHLASISGGTDLCGCLVLGDPTKPVYAGEIQTAALGVAMDVFNSEGHPAGMDEKGELVCTEPFPSMPLQFWGDKNNKRYRASYFETFDNVWRQGDYASKTVNGGYIIHGRSDATLNASGVRIGTSEIYSVVEALPEIVEAVAVGQEHEGDTRIVLFVRLSAGVSLTEKLKATISTELVTKCSPRHRPAIIGEVSDIPKTFSGKIIEIAVTQAINGREISNLGAIVNPAALDEFRNAWRTTAEQS